MCGIAGVLHGPGSAKALIESLAHRGPNGIRVEAISGGSVGHARLSIIDLEGGWQPLHAAGSTIIGNGEIYNYLELSDEFGLGDKLSTGSDFEPLLHLYAREGPAAFRRLRGMYAFCLIGNDGRTWLMRDPFGIKPLYVLEREGAVLFASEPRAFLEAGLVARETQDDAVQELLNLNYTLGSRTIFPGISRLEPGQVCQVVDGSLRDDGTDRALPLSSPRKVPGEVELIDELDAVLQDSVSVHQRSDVPYGLFLSGGIDSATIATLMSRLNDRPVTAFTCGFDAAGAKDERAQAERVARALNLDWRETQFGEEDFWAILPQVAWAMDDPTADYATLPTYKLAEAAKDTLTVVLTGEGGDELFGGYGRYRRGMRPAWLGGRPAEPRPDDRFVLQRWREETGSLSEFSRLQQAQWADVATWLPNDLLLKLDRCLMAHGLEGRTPFLDRQVANFAFTLPDDFKVRGRYGKWLVRKWLERVCPAADPWARKQGFTVPVEAWIAPRAAELSVSVAKTKAVARVRSASQVAEAFANRRGWPLLFFAVWSLIHLEQASPDEALRHILPRL